MGCWSFEITQITPVPIYVEKILCDFTPFWKLLANYFDSKIFKGKSYTKKPGAVCKRVASKSATTIEVHIPCQPLDAYWFHSSGTKSMTFTKNIVGKQVRKQDTNKETAQKALARIRACFPSFPQSSFHHKLCWSSYALRECWLQSLKQEGRRKGRKQR